MTMSWSPARSVMWRTCPRQLLYHVVLRATPAQHEVASRRLGRVMHAGMEAAFRALSNGRHRNALSMAWFIAEAHEAMSEHRDAEHLRPAELAECMRLISNQLTALGAPQAGSILGIEYPFSFVHSGIPIDGIMDLVLRTGPKSIRIVDWKSGRIADRAELLEGNIALGIYSIAAARIWPWVEEIEVGLHSLRYNESQFLVVTREMQERVLSRLASDYHSTQAAVNLLDSTTIQETFPTRSGDHCVSCVYRSYCPIFAASNPPVRPEVDVAAERDRLDARVALGRAVR